jgi:aspartate kinase
VNVRVIDQGASELSIIVGVDSTDLEKGLNAIYRAFTA